MIPGTVFGKPFCLFSEVNGRLLLNGQPAAGATVEREYYWRWGEKNYKDTVVADSDGRFHFPVATGRTLFGMLMIHQPVIEQKMKVDHQGKSYDIWEFMKMDYDFDSELARAGRSKRPLRLVCRLEQDMRVNLDLGPSSRCDFE